MEEVEKISTTALENFYVFCALLFCSLQIVLDILFDLSRAVSDLSTNVTIIDAYAAISNK